MQLSLKEFGILMIAVIIVLCSGIVGYTFGRQQRSVSSITLPITVKPSTIVTPIPTVVKHVTSRQEWKEYTNIEFGFSFQYPPEWEARAINGNSIHVSDPQNHTLFIGFKRRGSTTSIVRSGVGSGDIVERGTIKFLGKIVVRNVVVDGYEDKSILYNNAAEIEKGDLVFTLSMDNLTTEPPFFYSGLSTYAENIADNIIESFKLQEGALPTANASCIAKKNVTKTKDFNPGVLIIIFDKSATQEQGMNLVKSHHLSVLHEYDSLGGTSVEVPEGSEAEWACTLEASPIIEYVEFDEMVAQDMGVFR